MSGVLIARFSLPPRLSLIFLWNSLKHVIYFIVSHTLDLADTAPLYHKVFLCSSVSHNWWLETWSDFSLIGVEGQAQEISVMKRFEVWWKDEVYLYWWGFLFFTVTYNAKMNSLCIMHVYTYNFLYFCLSVLGRDLLKWNCWIKGYCICAFAGCYHFLSL